MVKDFRNILNEMVWFAVVSLALLTSLTQAQDGTFLGSFTTRAHMVNGDLYLLSDRVLEIRNFMYDGQGPAAFFWLDTSATPTSGGIVAHDGSPSLNCATSTESTQLPASTGFTQRVEIPEGYTIANFWGGSLSVWCEAFTANFGEVVIPASAEVPQTAPDLDCGHVGKAAVPAIARTPEGYNCEPLNADFQVRWQIDPEDPDFINFELLGRIADDNYMAFGISGSETETFMIGADVVSADMAEGTARAVDYYLDQRAQCNSSRGACPDTVGGFDNDVSKVSGEKDFGLTLVRYTKPVVSDTWGTDFSVNGQPIDRTFQILGGSAAVRQFVAWAIGPVADNGYPLFHTAFSRQDGQDVSLAFGRSAVDNCEPLATTERTEAPTATPPTPFVRPIIGDSDNTTEFDLHIGPSGGPRGYTAITGEPSWGIAWYVNSLLIPKITLRRGTTYTFRVNGGNDNTDDANYHPFYITDSPIGGYFQLTPEERATETPYLGIDNLVWSGTTVTDFTATGVAPICRYETGPTTASKELGSFDDYFSSLDSSCALNPLITDYAAVLTFTPDENTPDKLYYHCVTHFNLGYEIDVINADAPVVTAAPTVAPTEPLGEGFIANPLTGQLEGSTLSYQVNTADPAADGQDTISVVLTVPAVAWVSWGISSTGQMVGGEAVVGLPDTGEVLKYSLTSQLLPGVVRMGEEQQTLIDASITQGETSTTLSFTKILLEEGEIPIDATGDNFFLSAYGLDNNWAVHARRESFIVNLASADGGVGESVQTRKQAMWQAHGWLASLAWGLFSPMAIGASLVRKFIPGNGTWFRIHQSLNFLVVLLTLIAFILAVVAISQETPDGFDAGHFDPQVTTHRTIGLVVFIFAFLQAISGLLRPHLPPSEPTPSQPDEAVDNGKSSKKKKKAEEQPEEAGDIEKSSKKKKKKKDEEQQEDLGESERSSSSKNKKKKKAEDPPAPPPPPPEKSLARKLWEVGHRVFGLGTLAMCWWQVQSGIKLYDVIFGDGDDNLPAALIAFWAVVGTLAAIFFVGRIASCFVK